MDIEIRPLTGENREDYLEYMDHVAFTDNKEWFGCYCRFFFIADNEEWFRTTPESNREDVSRRINEGKMRGYLAYAGGKPVGWCHVNDKSCFPRLTEDPEIGDAPEGEIVSVVCFTIAPDFRGKGIASRMLRRICEDYAGSGYKYLEAYPVTGTATNAEQYHGPTGMYEKAGFQVIRELCGRSILRKTLQAPDL